MDKSPVQSEKRNKKKNNRDLAKVNYRFQWFEIETSQGFNQVITTVAVKDLRTLFVAYET